MHAVGCVVAAPERRHERNEARANGQALDSQEALCQAKAMLRPEQLVGNRHAWMSVDRRTRIGQVFEEPDQRYPEGRGDLRKASNAYAVLTLLVFLHLLEGDARSLTEFRL